MFKKIKTKDTRGFSVLEILLVTTIFAIFSTAIIYLSLDTLSRDTTTNLKTEAMFYAQQGIEAVRQVRDSDFLEMESGDKGLIFSNGTWTFGPAPEYIDVDNNGVDEYARTITISDVYRNPGGEIQEGGTEYDDNTKKVNVTVTWTEKGVEREISMDTYMTNWRGDDWPQTTCDEWNTGTFTDTEAIDPGSGDCDVQLTEISGSGVGTIYSADLGYHANDVLVSGNYAYVAVNRSNRGLFIVNISDPTNPSVTSYLNIGDDGNSVTKNGNYLYMGRNRSPGLVTVNVSNPSFPYVTAYDISGDYINAAAMTGADYLMTASNDYWYGLNILDVSSPSNPYYYAYVYTHSAMHDIVADGNYAYAGSYDDNDGFLVFDISDPYWPSYEDTLDVGEEVNAIAISGNTAYAGVQNNNYGIRVVDISDPTDPSWITSVDVGDSVNDLVVSGDMLFAAVDDVNDGLAIVDISNPSSPDFISNEDIGGKGTGITTDGTYIYTTTTTSNKGLTIVTVPSDAISSTGTYESQAYDTGSTETRYNYIEWNNTDAPGGSIQIQIRTADSEANLSSATWVGPDGTGGTYFETARTPIVVDSSASGLQYFQYKVEFTSDGSESPVFHDVNINYTP